MLFPAAPENVCACTPGGVLGGCGGVTLHADFADSRNKFRDPSVREGGSRDRSSSEAVKHPAQRRRAESRPR